jgi:hypothetical protein
MIARAPTTAPAIMAVLCEDLFCWTEGVLVGEAVDVVAERTRNDVDPAESVACVNQCD